MHSFPLWFEIVMYALINPWWTAGTIIIAAIFLWQCVRFVKARLAKKRQLNLANLPVIVMPPDTKTGGDTAP